MARGCKEDTSVMMAIPVFMDMKSSRSLVLATLLGLSAMGAGLGLPALYAGLALSVSANLQEKFYSGATVSDAELDELALRRRQLLFFWDGWLGHDDLAQITLVRAEKLGLHKPEGRALMPEIMRLEQEALRRNPANAYAWARLAYARLVYNGPSRLVLEPLLLSIASAPYEPSLMASRIMLLLDTQPYWAASTEHLFKRQLGFAWLHNGMETAYAAFLEHKTEMLRPHLADDPVRLAQYDKWIADMRADVSRQ